MNGQNGTEHEKKQINAAIVIIIILLILLLIGAAVITVLLLRDRPKESDSRGTVEARGTIVTKDNVDKMIMNEDVVQDGYYDVSMSIDWHFKDGVSSDAMIANKTTNTRTVYFDLLTEDTEELVYSSPYIPVGESMQGFTLDKQMEAGAHDMIVRYHLVDENNVEVSNVSVGVTIYIE